ncbi:MULTISPECIES: Na+/H+ antiporter family protein [unclassified Gilliamella]|uniref:Na+/H+ antiporter family protein n=1 Tax=unclassified Gilliamella TaxID=2685620 RepID=UPI001C698243|nr:MULTISPECIES: Na+/H+ antiporter family protein [unclassified Gilliamella]MCX8574946.1 Na+/H+ antiporter family protein [Gilliamella sp. B3831]MCX8577328.1 Na+/H+ antiporter family protein [Gilliamella sp. B3815]MCX8579420.1 Na+/H+ antiporter family protein [Gilliamella sp. B2717]MCX8588704.1 Na+/H+ antiporter family protein [Gilliamella sp. B3801]MCX8591077.1 Na+/H+ antiporter family protein [Gilliamella sp. B3804]
MNTVFELLSSINAVVIAVICMLILSLCRVHVVISLIIGAFVGGLFSHLTLKQTIDAFNTGISNGANIALSYAMLGAFAVAISKSGLPELLADKAVKQLTTSSAKKRIKWLLIIIIALVSISSQNIIPIHIAFIPLLIPPLLYVMSRLQLDRRMIACIMTFGLITPYMFLPVGFGNIFLNQILLKNITASGMDVSHVNVMHAMAIPALGMFVGLLWAIFVSYRKPREYKIIREETNLETVNSVNKRSLIVSLLAIVLSFAIQLYTGSMILGALIGFICFIVSGTIKWGEADGVFTDGIKMMAMIGFVMISAQGFAEVLKQTNDIEPLVINSAALFAGNKVIASFMMMLVGLVITLGIGSSFSTVPIIAAIYVPLCIQLGFSPIATVCLIGASGAIGDAGSPPSDTILATSAGLNSDGQHDHIRDSVIPTFTHFNIPLFIAGWVGSLIL